MKKSFCLLILSVFILAACKSKDNNAGNNTASKEEPGLLESLKKQKADIDTLYNHSTDQLITMAKLTDNDSLITLKEDVQPEDLENTFSILKDSTGRIITISEFPQSQSGDWHLVLTHYFNKEGNTFAFEKQTNFFNSMCTEGAAFETKTFYFNGVLNQLDSLYKLVDKDNHALQKDSCQFPYNFDYKISPTLDGYLQEKKIRISK